MKNATLALLISVLIPSFPLPSFADRAVWENAKCGWYFPNMDADDPLISDFYASFGSGAVMKACEFPINEVQAYFLASPVRQSPFGVCQYTIDQVYPLQPALNGRTQWSFQRPLDWGFSSIHEVFMSVSAAECPLQNDDVYVPATSVSQGVFLSFIEFLNDIHARKSIPTSATKYMLPQDRQSGVYLEFERVLLGSAVSVSGETRNLKLLSVSIAQRLSSMNGNFFEAAFGVQGDNVTIWTMVFDVAPEDGIHLIKVSKGTI